jgi:hypothetical protein
MQRKKSPLLMAALGLLEMGTLGIGSLAVLAAAAHADPQGMRTGKVELQSAGPLAFGPDAVLFIGDSSDGSIVALATGDTKPGKAPPADIKAVNEKIAALLGTAPDQILINDAVVNPLSKYVYLSVTRGRGPEAQPVILRTNAKGQLEELRLEKIAHAKAALPNAPEPGKKDRAGREMRMDSITDIEFSAGQVIVAGLSNEEFSSKLRSIPYPFAAPDPGASVEIYHGSHGRFETNSPVRTFVSYNISGQPHILAAYTCTPLVKFQLSDLKPGNKVVGTTIAELGNRNRPLDMIVYRKGSGGSANDFILMNNSSRGVMKMSTQGIEQMQAITARVPETAGLPFETLADVKGVEQLDRWDDATAMLLVKADSGSLDIRTLALP